MTATPRVLEPQCEWTSSDVADEAVWTEHFDAAELAELDAALRARARRSRTTCSTSGRDDFPLPTLGDRLLRIEDELINGRGFVRLRGIDRRAYTQAEMEVLYWGIGTHLGLPWAQNKHGHVLGDVTDQNKAANDPTARGNELGGIALPFHCDGSDLVGLMCLENGAQRRPVRRRQLGAHPQPARDRAARPRGRALRGAALRLPRRAAAGGKPYYLVPVFTEWEDRLFVRCIPPYIWASQRHPEAPRLTDAADRGAARASSRWPTIRPTTCSWTCCPATCSSSTTTTCSTAARPTRTIARAGHIRHLKRLWLETTVLTSRPPYFANNRSHWSEKRTASRLEVR